MKATVVDYEAPICSLDKIGQSLRQVLQDCEKGKHLDMIQFVTKAPVRLCPYKHKGHMGVKTHVKQPDGTLKLTQPHYLSMKSPCYCGLIFLGKQLAT